MLDALNVAFPLQMRAARSLLGWSQAELSRQTGVSQPTINRLERGQSQGTPETLRTLQACLRRHGVRFETDPGGAVQISLTAEATRSALQRLYGRPVTLPSEP